MRNRVLVVEADTELGRMLRTALVEDGQDAHVASPLDAAPTAARLRPHVVVLSWPSAGEGGRRLCEATRVACEEAAILVTTVLRSVDAMRSIFAAGADDFMRKPFGLAELLLRVRALVRRGARAEDGPLRAGDIRLDPRAREVTVDGLAVRLTQREFLMLRHLLERADRVVSRAELARLVWGAKAPPSNVVVAHATHLRAKLGSAGAQLRTVRGVGYLLASEASCR